ncbi:MAG: DUF262 domain-containing protein [Oscillospiraceae bacterium]|nr:DUF262 domain-containing protein [Oscillospiraceae bacterium]
MKFELHEISIREVVENYVDNDEEGVIGYNGKLNIRPPYQREFVYNDVRRNAVIFSILKGFPLNVMYWVVNSDGTYEILDGQQRTLSLCKYVAGDFPVMFNGKPTTFENLPTEKQQAILDYKLMIYFCQGNDKGKLDWFRIINITGEKLTEQELRNVIYTGEWLAHAKRIFSKQDGDAYLLASDYISGSLARQELLEKAISWISNGRIEKYMAAHQHDSDANELWEYFSNVIEWAKATFPVYRKEMKGLDWGAFYSKHKNEIYDPEKLESVIESLMKDVDVMDKSGVYQYLLSGDEKHLNIRSFSENQKREAYDRQEGVCVKCAEHFDLGNMRAEHIIPWKSGGKTIAENCQLMCKDCLI